MKLHLQVLPYHTFVVVRVSSKYRTYVALAPLINTSR